MPHKNQKPNDFIRKALRLLPTTLGLLVILFVYYKYPDQLKKLYTNLTGRLRVTESTQNTAPNTEKILEKINSIRRENNQKPYSSSDSLIELSKLLALDTANTPDNKPTLDLKKTAKSLEIDYSQIAYIILTESKSSIKSFDDILLSEENKQTVLSNQYSHIGIHTLNTKDQNQLTITVLTFASFNKAKATTKNNPKDNPSISYTGADLWLEIQKYRKTKGVPEFRQDNTLCTLTSIRVNQLIKINSLDDHKGFEPLVNQYRLENKLSFGNLGENILMGYPTANEAVKAWDGSLGHRALMADGSYVWACVSANHGFAVLIAAY